MLDLTMTITADASQAKAELRQVEQGVQKVESASTKAEAPIVRVAQALSGQQGASQKLAQANQALEDTTRKLTAAGHDHSKLTNDQFVQLAMAGRLNDDLRGRVDKLDTSYKTLAVTRASNAQAMLALGVAGSALALVAAAELAFIYKASEAYLEKSGILDEHRDSIAGVTDAWEDLLFMAGQQLVGSGVNFNNWIGMLEIGLRVLSVVIVDRIAEFQRLLDLIELVGTGGRSFFDGEAPTPANAQRDVNGELTAAGRLALSQQRQDAQLASRGRYWIPPSAADAQRLFDTSEREREQASKRAAADLERHAAAIQKLVDAYTGAAAIRTAKDAIEAVTQAAREGMPIHRMSAEAQATINKVVGDGIDAYRQQGTVAPEAMRLVWLATLQGIPAVRALGSEFDDIGIRIPLAVDKIRESGRQLFGAFTPTTLDFSVPDSTGGELTNLPGLRMPIPTPPEIPTRWIDDAEVLGRELERIGHLIPGVAGALLTMAGAGVSGFGRMSNAAKTFGKDVMQSAASVIDIGFSVFSIVQSAVSFLERDNLAGKTVREFEAAQGGARQLAADAALAGVSLKALYNTDSASRFARESERVVAAIKAQKEALDRYGLSWRDFNSVVAQTQVDQIARVLITDFRALSQQGVNPERLIEGMSGALNQLIIDAVRSGTQIPGALQPIIEKMIRMGLVTDAAARAMLGLAEDTMPSLADIKDAADRYGLSLDDLGDKVQQLRITEAANQIIADFNLLADAGVDTAMLLSGSMGDALQDIVTEALKTGREVPEALRPILQQMIDLGLLVDASGNKLADLNGITFGADLVSSIELLIAKLDDLVDALSSVGTAAEDAGRRAAPPGAVYTGGWGVPDPLPGTPGTPEPPPSPEPDDPDAPAGARPNPAPAHTGGYLYAGKVYPYQTLHTGGLAGDEFFIRAQSNEFMMQRSAVARYGRGFMHDVNQGRYQPGGQRRDITIRVPISVDGKVFLEAVAKETLQ